MSSQERIIGRRAVLEAIYAGRRRIEKIVIARGLKGSTFREIVDEATRHGIAFEEIDRKRLKGIVGTDEHQGIIALASPLEDESLASILARARVKGEPPFFVVVDGVTDPQNMGAILRTAEASGAHGVVVPHRNTARLDGATTKASSGAVEHVPVARVGNIGQTLERMRESGIKIVGTDTNPSATPLYRQDLSGPIAVVLGSEGKGLPPRILLRCDHKVTIPLKGKIQSLNVSAAAAVVLFEVLRQRSFAVEA